jgi:hypothetical protein
MNNHELAVRVAEMSGIKMESLTAQQLYILRMYYQSRERIIGHNSLTLYERIDGQIATITEEIASRFERPAA